MSVCIGTGMQPCMFVLLGERGVNSHGRKVALYAWAFNRSSIARIERSRHTWQPCLVPASLPLLLVLICTPWRRQHAMLANLALAWLENRDPLDAILVSLCSRARFSTMHTDQ
eukprot:2682939-Amphidinium_carterae.1